MYEYLSDIETQILSQSEQHWCGACFLKMNSMRKDQNAGMYSLDSLLISFSLSMPSHMCIKLNAGRVKSISERKFLDFYVKEAFKVWVEAGGLLTLLVNFSL